MSNEPKQPFEIGLCLAGAVSAGAYSAGVMDYLLEALEIWEQEKVRDPANTPMHQVRICDIGGASAGGIIGLLTATALHGRIVPAKWKEGDDVMAERPNNLFYHTWVDLTHPDMFQQMLLTNDITEAYTKSLLNTAFIDRTAERALSGAGSWVPRPFIANDMRVFSTLTNLEGFYYSVTFNSRTRAMEPYHVQIHNDYGCFRLNSSLADYSERRDGWIPLDFTVPSQVTIARQVAMATAAFPIGLKAREVVRPKDYINDHCWFKWITERNPVVADVYKSMNVDGGLINNEPFERVRELICDRTGQKEATARQSYDTFKGTILMIDPFPTTIEEFKGKDALLRTMSNTLGAMIGQLRTKPKTLDDAMGSAGAGQFLISPTRELPTSIAPDVELKGSDAIACGQLGGFSGFLHKEFRVHDYFLGRYNCEKFLRDIFTVPANTENPIFRDSYAALSPIRQEFFRSVEENDKGFQIIPIFKPRSERELQPVFAHSGCNWPMRRTEDIDRFDDPLRKRTNAILTDLVNTDGWLNRLLFWAGKLVYLNRKGSRFVRETIKNDLQEHWLLPGGPKKKVAKPYMPQQDVSV